MICIVSCYVVVTSNCALFCYQHIVCTVNSVLFAQPKFLLYFNWNRLGISLNRGVARVNYECGHFLVGESGMCP